MWIWLTISMLLVIACIVFGIYSFISSRSIQRSISIGTIDIDDTVQPQVTANGFHILQQQAFAGLKLKLKSIEENSMLSMHHLNELQKKVEVLESEGNVAKLEEEAKWEDPGEDWEKLYYEARREKQSLEDDLNQLKEALQESADKVREMESRQAEWAKMKIEMEAGISEVHGLRNVIGELERKLKSALQREGELEIQLSYERTKHNEVDDLQKQNKKLQSEVDMLTSMLHEIHERNNFVEKKLESLAELGSFLEISEYEKMGIKNSLAQLMHKK